MKYVQNLRGKTEQEILDALGDAAFPVLIGGGDENDSVKVFIDENRESLSNRINTATDIQEAFDITYKPYIINGYDQRLSLTTSLGFGTRYFNVYKAGVLENPPYYYNYSKVSPVTFSSTNTDIATIDSNGVVTVIASGTTTIKVNFDGNSKYKPHEDSYELNVDIPIQVDPEPDYYLTYNGHKYVDLGLPSGKKWAAYSMGASALNEPGDEYYWGNTNPVSTNNPDDKFYSPSVGEYGKDGYIPESWSKYNETDNKTTIDLSDDAAHVNWGGNWKMPTSADFIELANTENTTATLVKNYLKRGADGILFTSKTNGNSLFFPVNHEIGTEWASVELFTCELDEGYDPWRFIMHIGDATGEPRYLDECVDNYDSFRFESNFIRPVC